MQIRSNVITFRVPPALAGRIRTASRGARQSVSTFLNNLVTGALQIPQDSALGAMEPGRQSNDLGQPVLTNHKGPIS
jgi:hypothetical protein